MSRQLRGESDASTRNLAAAIVAPTSFDDKGLTLAQELCADGCKVIVLTDSHQAAEMGSRIIPNAHAFLAQPVDEQRLTALLAEIAAAQAREGAASTTVLQFEGRSLDLGGHAFVDENGREVPLTHAEFELLSLFARSSGRVLSRDQLRVGISGRDLEPYDRSIDMLVARLRRKIEPNAKSPLLHPHCAGRRVQICATSAASRVGDDTANRVAAEEGERRTAPSRASAAERPSVPDPRMGGPIDPARS